MAVLCIDDANVRSLTPLITRPVTTYGLTDGAQIRAVDVEAAAGQMRFRVARKIRLNGHAQAAPGLRITRNPPAPHHAPQALASRAAGLQLGAPGAATS